MRRKAKNEFDFFPPGNQGVIDFSLYLRSHGSSLNGGGGQVEEASSSLSTAATSAAAAMASERLTAVLDQKNYVEEMNKNLT